MHLDVERQRTFTRRALILAGGQVLLLSSLVGRLYQLQVVDSPRYQTLAEENRINMQLLPPPRGRILDRRGRPLAVNRQSYRVLVVAEQAGNVEATLDALARIINISDADRQRVLKEAARRRSFVPVTVRDNLTWEEVARIEVNAPELPGVGTDELQAREYPFAADCAHIVGYVAAVGEGEEGDDPLLQLPDFRIGKAGIEKSHDTALRGSGGRSEVEVNAYGRVIRELKRREGRAGVDLVSTIDIDLQRFALGLLDGRTGAIVLLHVPTGDVLAMASHPTFDPSPFARGLTRTEWRELMTHRHRPLINKAIAGQYAPGSTFKMVVALAGLERGTISPGTRVTCSGAITVGDNRFHCWSRGGHGSVDLHRALVESCDVYFYEVAQRVGIDRLAATARRLGLGAPVGIDLPGERPGLVPTRDWKEATRGASWHIGETLLAGIGQGYVLATPLQLAVMTARLASGGKMVVPRVVRMSGGEDHDRPNDLGIPAAHLRAVNNGMIGVVNSARGTAKKAAIRQAGMEMAGKTGTSQVRRISLAERRGGVRRNETLPWNQRDHALFVGYAPVQAPRFAVAVIIEHGGQGSKVAAPVARDMLLAAQRDDLPRVAALAFEDWTDG